MKKPSDRAGRPRRHAAHGMSRTKPSGPRARCRCATVVRASAAVRLGEVTASPPVDRRSINFLSALLLVVVLLVDIRPCDRSNGFRTCEGSERASARALPNSRSGGHADTKQRRQSEAHLIHSIHSSDPIDPPDPLVRCRLTADYYLSPRATGVRSNPVYLFSDLSPRSDQRTKSARTGLGRGRPRSDR